jgi:hypothetical protein
MAAASKVMISPLSLYKHLLRMLRPLPEDIQTYYKHRIRQEYKSYADETDKERIQEIITQTLKDADWIINKVLNNIMMT